MKTMALRHYGAEYLKKAGNSNRQKGTCMKCYNMEVLNAEMSFFQSKDDLRSYVNLGKSNTLNNESIIKWQVEPTQQ